ncbi:MAG: flagellar hook-basal body complex protein FliE [Actinoplanes sp.]
MVSPISAISGLSGIGGVDNISKVNGTSGLSGLGGASGTAAAESSDENFARMLSKGLESVQGAEHKADTLATQAANGTLKDPAQYTMAANEAALGLQLTLAVRNKAVEAFQEIMRMQA